MKKIKNKLLITDEWLNDCIKESFEETDGSLTAVAKELQEIIRNIFGMDCYDKYKEPNYRFFAYKDKLYKLEIEEDGVCEVTYSHRILYWKVTITTVETDDMYKNLVITTPLKK